MNYNDSGKFRGCWMFDTHHAVYHLDELDNIVGIHCDTVRDEVLGIQTTNRVGGYIGNPGVFALSESQDTGIDLVLTELTRTYSHRIQKWLRGGCKIDTKVAA